MKDQRIGRKEMRQINKEVAENEQSITQSCTHEHIKPGLYSVRRTQAELRKRIYADTRVMTSILCTY